MKEKLFCFAIKIVLLRRKIVPITYGAGLLRLGAVPKSDGAIPKNDGQLYQF